jgi:hypothetical protein
MDYGYFIKTSPYPIINGIFLIILLGIFSYSALFSAARNNYPIPGSEVMLKGRHEISTGLSHSFSELVRGRIESARKYNEYGPRIFLFFLIQLFMRPLFLFLFSRFQQRMFWIYLDAGASIVLFLFAFWPFILRFTHTISSL